MDLTRVMLVTRFFRCEECEHNFVTITEARLKSDSVVKACNFIGQKNIN